MPLYTELVRGGKPVPVGGWTWWHLNRLHEAMVEESVSKDLDKVPFLPPRGVYKFREAHSFDDPEEVIWRDGELGKSFNLVIKPGDEYHAWRGSK